MNSMGFNIALRAAHLEATSALPDAPIVLDDASPHRVRATRRWAAAHLRGVARGTYRLADRVDPLSLPRHA